jgi:hypothetical protein
MKKIKKLTPSDVEKIAHDKLHEKVLNAATIDATAIEGNDLILELGNGVKHNAGQVIFHGRDGIDGSDGRDGRDGIDGIRGPQGFQGEQGFRGALGPQGIMGPQGARGATGPIGPQGARGPIPRHEFKSMQDGRLQIRFELPDGKFGDWQILNDRAAIFGGGSTGVSKSYINTHVLGYTVTNDPETGDILEFNGENLTWVPESTETKSWAASLIVGNTSVGGGTNNPTLSAGDLLEGTDAGIAITGDTSPYGSATEVLNLTGLIDCRRTETVTDQTRPVHHFERCTVTPSGSLSQATDYHGFDLSIALSGTGYSGQTVGAYSMESTVIYGSTENIDRGVGMFSQVRLTAASTMTEGVGYQSWIRCQDAGATISSAKNFLVYNATADGIVDAQYALWTQDLNSATENWVIYSLGGNSYHEGDLYLGRTAPLGTEKLSVNGTIRCDEVIANTGTFFLDDSLAISNASRTLLIQDLARDTKFLALLSEYDDTGSTPPVYIEMTGVATTAIQTLEDEQSGSFTFTVPIPLGVNTTAIRVKPKAAGDGNFSVQLNDASGKVMVTGFDVTFSLGEVDTVVTVPLPNDILNFAGEASFNNYTGVDLAGHTYAADPTFGTGFYPLLSIDSQATTDRPISIQDAAFNPDVIPYADSNGLLTSNDTQLLWDPSKEQLLVGTDDTSGFQKVSIVSNVVSSTAYSALNVGSTNGGTGRPIAITSSGVLSHSYESTDFGDDYAYSLQYITNDVVNNTNYHLGSRRIILHNGTADLTNTSEGGLGGDYTIVTANNSGAVTRMIGSAYLLGTDNDVGSAVTDAAFYSVQASADGGDITNAIALDLQNDVAGSASVLNHFLLRTDTSSPYVDSDTLIVDIDGTTRYIPTYDQPISSGAYTQTFTDGDLTAGVLTVNHALNQDILIVAVTDNTGNIIVPDEVTFTDADNADIDLSSYGTITGTWQLLLSIGNPATGENVSILDDTEKEIFNAQDLLDVSGGTGTITVDGVSLILTFKNEDTIVSPVKIVAQNGATVTIQGTGTGTWAWSNIGTMITSTDSTIRIRGMNMAGLANLSSPFSATLIDFDSSSNTDYTMNISRTNLLYWVGGSHDTGVCLMRFVGFIDWFGPLTLTNTGIVELQSITIGKINVPALGQICLKIQDSDPESVIKMISASGRVDTGDYFLRVDPVFSAKFLLNGIVTTGTLFNETGSDGTFTSITDATITAQSITSVTDSSGTARFNFTPGPTVYQYQKVTISGYTTNTDYNVTGIISAAGAGYFEIDGVDYGTDEAGGAFDSDSITLTTPDTLTDGDTVYIDGQYSIEIDGGSYVYNAVAATSFQINAVYPGATTYNGTWCTRGLNERNPRVLVTTSPGNTESAYRAFVHIEDNGQTTTAVDGEYNDMNLAGDSAAITAYATNGVGGTTVTSAGHGLVALQNVTIADSGDDTYNNVWQIFNITLDTFDIAVAFSTDPTTKGSWNSGPIVGDSMERFKLTDPTTMEITYIGLEDRSFTCVDSIGAEKTGSAQDYQFAVAKDNVVEAGFSYTPRTISPALAGFTVSQDLEMAYGQTIKPKQAGKGTSSDLIVTNIRMEVS